MGEDVVRGKKYKKQLRVEMTDKEIEKKGRSAGHLKKEFDQIKAKQKAAADMYKEELAEVKTKLDAVLADLEAGGDERNVDCVDEKDFKRNVVRTIRLDTNEVAETRALAAEERQEMIDGADDGEGAPAEEVAEEKPKRSRKKKAAE